jgi:hypothetical protein
LSLAGVPGSTTDGSDELPSSSNDHTYSSSPTTVAAVHADLAVFELIHERIMSGPHRVGDDARRRTSGDRTGSAC